MLRIVVVAWFAVLASCNSDDKRAPAANVNKVVEVTGKVSARRDNQPARWLVVGDAVNPDDSIETSADGHIVIELAHNLARWELGPNSAKRVDASLAWGLPLRDKNAKAPEQNSAAAGRHAERAAADTTRSASDEPDFSPKGGGDDYNKAKAAALEASKNSGIVRQQAKSDSKPDSANPADPLGGDSGGGTAAVTAKIDTAKSDTAKPDVDPGPPPPTEPAVDAQAIYRKRQDAMADCLKGAVSVTIRVRAVKGKPTFAISGTPAPTATIKSCLTILLKSIASDPKLADATYDFKLEMQKQ